MTPQIPDLLVVPIVRMALAEDLGRAGDLTSQACVPEAARLSVSWTARRPGVLCGLSCARLALHALAPEARFEVLVRDGDPVAPGQVLARAEAPARAVLSAERTGLNLAGRLSGIATLTRAYVEAVAGTGAQITDTRKTTPGLRNKSISEYSRSNALPTKRSASTAGRIAGCTQVDFRRSVSRETASRLRLKASQRASSTSPSALPFSVRRMSALSSRSIRRNSARLVNMR